VAPLSIPDTSPSRRGTRPSWHRRLVFGLLLVAVTSAGLYVAWLDRVVAEQFAGRRWDVPTQVYARPLELRPGLPLPGPALEQELKRLGYRSGSGAKPGSYRRQGSRFDVMLRKARFADRQRAAQLLRVTADGAAIRSLADADGRSLAKASFEPLLIGSLFPVHGEDRIVVPPGDVPPLLPAALKVIEDRRRLRARPGPTCAPDASNREAAR